MLYAKNLILRSCRRAAAPALAAVFAAAQPLLPGTFIAVSGRVPHAVNDSFVNYQYRKIWKAVSPDAPADTAPLAIIYYGKNDERRLGVRLPEWGGGGAIGRDTIIVPVDHAPVADMDIPRVTVHELVHIALERAYGGLRLPRWFHEGLAMTLSGELSFDEQIALSRAIFAHCLMPLDSVERVNRFDAYGAALAYSQSHLAVALLIEKYGIDGIPELLNEVRETGRFGTALSTVFGLSIPEFDRLVQDSLAERFRSVFFFSDTYLYWSLGAVLLVVGYGIARRRKKRRMRQMEEEEEEERMKDEGGRMKEEDERIKAEGGRMMWEEERTKDDGGRMKGEGESRKKKEKQNVTDRTLARQEKKVRNDKTAEEWEKGEPPDENDES